jgi:hypothetical protein
VGRLEFRVLSDEKPTKQTKDACFNLLDDRKALDDQRSPASAQEMARGLLLIRTALAARPLSSMEDRVAKISCSSSETVVRSKSPQSSVNRSIRKDDILGNEEGFWGAAA